MIYICLTIHGGIRKSKPYHIGENYIVEDYLGKDFKTAIYGKMDKTDREKHAHEFAKMLCFVHQRNITNELRPIEYNKNVPIEDIYGFYRDYMGKSEERKIKNLVLEFNNRDMSDEVVTLTHRDIRSQNVLYDSIEGQLALIDFGCSKKDSIYWDFVPIAAPLFNMHYGFLRNVVEEYNRISPIKINMGKLRILHEVLIYHKFSRECMEKKVSKREFRKKFIPLLKGKLTNLELYIV